MSMDVDILRAMRQAAGGSVSGAELSHSLGVSRAAIWARVQDLRSLGYDIEASPHQGYRMLSAPDLLHADDLLSRLGPVRVIGRDIRVFQETTSTNDVAEKLARDGAKEGVVVFAESQTKGRGRLGRKWISPPGKGLWFSVLLRPTLRPEEATRLTIVAATALRRAIALATRLEPEIKWPNDILIRGRKTAGILTEMHAEPDQVKYLVLGMGVDVNLEAAEFPPELHKSATSLRVETGKLVDRPDLARCILEELDAEYLRLTSGRFAEVADEWESHCSTLGRQVSIRLGERLLRGRAEALGEDGALLVRSEHGRLEPVIGGDVTLEKLS
jgi:BirA family biotin operon repressor/biotin-[acetyl-CoA-carboxylase] ligase